VNVDVRICKDCKHTLFSKSDFARELGHKPSDARTYENLVQFERGIRLLLPKFQKLLVALQDPNKPPTPSQLDQAGKVRKRLMDSFTQYDAAARRIRDLPSDSLTQQKLQKLVYQQASSFLHLHMLPLKSLPKVLKHASPHGLPNGNTRNSTTRPNGALANLKLNDIDSSSQVSGSSISAMETEEKQLQEQLIVLEEQKFLVQEMVNDAKKKRHFDEVTSLQGNVADLSREIDGINSQLSQLDFAGVYGGIASARPEASGAG